jgi:hypothetical protein
MEEFEKNERKERDEIFSKSLRAGKRTYFFDVKATRAEDFYLTITESKKRFNNETGKFFYEKHKLFLYKEDFENFTSALNDAIRFIDTGEKPVEETHEQDNFSDVDFDELTTQEDK